MKPKKKKNKQPASYYHVKNSKKRNVINQGSSRSGKTYSTLQVLCELCWYYAYAGFIISIVRKTLPALKATAYRDFLEIVKNNGWYKSKHHNKTECSYNLFGNYFEFFSVDDAQKVRGRKRDILFINEANELSKDDFVQLNMRTESKIILDYNPSERVDWIEALEQSADCEKYITTYKDNPKLSPNIVAAIESLKDKDPEYWMIYGLGQHAKSNKVIYHHWQTCKQIPKEGRVCYGLDFGYNDPTALVKLTHFEGANYVEELLYQTHLTNDELIEQLKILEIDKNAEIFADASRPEIIEAIYHAGFNVHAADKAVREGIKRVKSQPLYIVETSLNLLEEVKHYRWKSDKEGRLLDEPVKHKDHLLDAKRYAIYNQDKKLYHETELIFF